MRASSSAETSSSLRMAEPGAEVEVVAEQGAGQGELLGQQARERLRHEAVRA